MTEPIVLAGGGILWRRSEGGMVEIVLVHRPGWSAGCGPNVDQPGASMVRREPADLH